MALIRCHFFYDVLELSTSMTVILPQQTTAQIGLRGARGAGAPRTLYLLYGLSDDDTIWLRRTSIERYVAPLGLAVVMPQVHRSFYADMAHGGAYWTFLTDELPRLVGEFFRVSATPADTFVAGLSMGGYGALKWALNRPDRFAAAASLSGGLDMAERRELARADPEGDALADVFGPGPLPDTDNLIYLIDRAAAAGTRLPALYACCGTEDFLYAGNLAFVAACGRAGVPLTWEPGPGEHEWGYWDRKIQNVLAWLPMGRR